MKLNLNWFLIFLITSLSCNNVGIEKRRQGAVEKYTGYVYKHKDQLEDLTRLLVENKNIEAQLERSIEVENLEPDIRAHFLKLNIHSYQASIKECGKVDIEYTTNWTTYPIGTLYLSKDYCFSNATYKDIIKRTIL